MAISKDQRRLLIVSNLTDFGRSNLRWLYKFIDTGSVSLAQAILGHFYKQVSVLEGEKATANAFVHRLTRMAKAPGAKAVDVLLHLHGGQGQLWFAEGAVTTSSLAARIRKKNIDHRLRLLYSTACYGATHAQDFVDAGFSTASGAQQTNANAAHDYPIQLGTWALNRPYRAVVRAGNRKMFRDLYDGTAKVMGFTDVNSYKIIRGDKDITIRSNAT